VTAQDILVTNPIRDMKFLGGLVSLKAGVDGIVIDSENEWLYFGAINNGGLYRAKIRDLVDPATPRQQLNNEVERFSDKPLSDGLSADLSGNIYITDVEHGSVFLVGTDRVPRTLIRSPKIRWADSLSFGPDGWLYLADSAIPELVLKSKEYIESRGPYYIYRFQPGFSGMPGQ
jgi:hypothetical protein